MQGLCYSGCFKTDDTGESMRSLGFLLVWAALSASPALAQDTCQSKAIGKDGKALHGAALNSFMTKCARDVCEPKAIDKNGKPLAGAAKTSFLKKCQAEA